MIIEKFLDKKYSEAMYFAGMFLLAFTGLIGLLILFILPNKNDSNDGT